MDKNKLIERHLNIKIFLLKTLNKLISDEIYTRIIYRFYFKRKINLNSPKSFNEKIGWLKLNFRSELLTLLADKFEVRKYVEKTIGKEYLIPLIGVYSNVSEINFNKLPEEFIIKTNHASHLNIICSNKKNLNTKKSIKLLNKWLKINYYWLFREWAYKNIRPLIVIEELIKDKKGNLPLDYKFFCFNGKVEIIQVDFDRFNEHRRNLYDKDWNIINVNLTYKNYENKFEKPKFFEEMKHIAEKLSSPFPFVRVDLYYIDNKIYFGEMTFYPGGGFEPFDNYKFDLLLGDKIRLDNIKEKELNEIIKRCYKKSI